MRSHHPSEAIERGEHPQWDLKIQVMPEQDATRGRFNPFDLTKVWPHQDYPLVAVGVLELNRNPENYFADVEQAAFAPANIVPGIGFSPDKVLQARILSYTDAHRHRLGVNYEALPVNRPRCPVHHYHRDGQMRFDGNGGSTPSYEPNSLGGPVEDPTCREPALRIDGDADRYDHREGNDDYTQAGDLYRLMTAEERTRLVENLVASLRPVPREIQIRQVRHFHRADRAYGEAVARALELPPTVSAP